MASPPPLYFPCGKLYYFIASEATIGLKIARALRVSVELCQVQWGDVLVNSILQNGKSLNESRM
jgi:hypothetical protein